MNGTLTSPLPQAPVHMRDRAERLATLAQTLCLTDPQPAPGTPPPMPRAPTNDANEERYFKLIDANRELYMAEYAVFINEAREYRNAIEAWALDICNSAKALGGPASYGSPPLTAAPQATEPNET